jgi:hypothetical protein
MSCRSIAPVAAISGTDCARAQVWTLRERLLKLGARVLVSVRRVVVHLPTAFPFLSTSRHLAVAPNVEEIARMLAIKRALP